MAAISGHWRTNLRSDYLMAQAPDVLGYLNQPSQFNQGFAALGQGIASVAKAKKAQEAEQAAQKEKESAIAGQKNAAMKLAAMEQTEDPNIKEQLFIEAYQLSPNFVKGFIDSHKSVSEDKTKLQQGTGDMSGYSFNPDTGKFSLQEDIAAALKEKAAAMSAEKTALDAKDRLSINKDVTGLISGSNQIYKAAQDLKTLKASSSPTSQLAAVFKLMKALDPTSVVREGEQDQARSTGGAADYLIGYATKLQGGGSLPEGVFTDMVDTASNLANSAIVSTEEEINDYLDTFGESIPTDFKESLKRRVPKKIAAPSKTYQTAKYGTVTESDIHQTMKDNGMTRAQVLNKLGVK